RPRAAGRQAPFPAAGRRVAGRLSARARRVERQRSLAVAGMAPTRQVRTRDLDQTFTSAGGLQGRIWGARTGPLGGCAGPRAADSLAPQGIRLGLDLWRGVRVTTGRRAASNCAYTSAQRGRD